MLKRVIVVICLLVLSGCATDIIRLPNPPLPPNISSIADIPFVPATTKSIKYVAKDRKNSMTQDNVTVEVESIADDIQDKNLSVTIQGADDKEYQYSVFPMMVVLKITNGTNHIVTLERTIVRLEDEKQSEYPMIVTADEAKQDLIKKVSNMFDSYNDKFEQAIKRSSDEPLQGYRSSVFGDYAQQYKQALSEFQMAASKTFYDYSVKPSKLVYPDNTFEMLNLQAAEPNTVYDKMSTFVKRKFAGDRQKKERLSQLKQQALRKINDEIKISMKGVITSGVYQPINILPGRTEKVIVPFAKRHPTDEITTILIGVFDLPTEVNAAGVPIKRANFNFEMTDVNVKP